jgi:hypothetical protein
MIIESLNSLHATLVASRILPPTGFQHVRARYIIELSERGLCIAVTDHAKVAAKGAWFAVPLAVRRGSTVKPSLLWDDCKYTLGALCSEWSPENQIKAVEQRHCAFLDRLKVLRWR